MEDKAFKGHTKVQQFKLFVDSNGCPMMKYMVNYSNNNQLPNEVGGIKLWQKICGRKILWLYGNHLF